MSFKWVTFYGVSTDLTGLADYVGYYILEHANKQTIKTYQNKRFKKSSINKQFWGWSTIMWASRKKNNPAAQAEGADFSR